MVLLIIVLHIVVQVEHSHQEEHQVLIDTPNSQSGFGDWGFSPSKDYGAGGGGGYYGGGAGCYYGAGGGGSNFVDSSGISNITRTQGYQSGNGQIIIGWNSYHGCTSSRNSVSVTMTGCPFTIKCVASPSSINCGSSSNISATTTGTTIRWYDSSTGGTCLAVLQAEQILLSVHL